jgi:hypothetical protein
MIEQIVVVALIGVGLAYTGAKLDGPFGLATWLKERILNARWAPGWLQRGVECVFCWLFWMTLLATVGWWAGEPGMSLATIAAVWLGGFGLGVVVFLWVGE